jgi:3-oxoacyl-[acyl-carrier-protein] synthase-3
MAKYSKIVGTGSYLPPRRVTNQELAEQIAKKGVKTSDEWIFSRSGIVARHYAEKGVKSSDLAAVASRKALSMAGILAEDINLIIVATSTMDYAGGFPSTACVVQQKLGITNDSPAFDVQAACSGFVYAVSIADSFIKAGVYKNVLVIGSEVFSSILDFKDRTTCVLFGDGAGAVVMTSSSKPGVLATKLHADGKCRDILCMSEKKDISNLSENKYTLHMDGPAVFKLAVSVLERVANEVLKTAGMVSSEIDWLIPHQANIRIMHSTARKLGLDNDRMVVTVHQHGNTSAASIPLALDQATRDGRIKVGNNIMMEGVGSGFTWGAIISRM